VSEVAVLAIGGMDLDEDGLISSEHNVHQPSAVDPNQDICVPYELELIFKGQLGCVFDLRQREERRETERDRERQRERDGDRGQVRDGERGRSSEQRDRE
jgi:hypothetical protein